MANSLAAIAIAAVAGGARAAVFTGDSMPILQSGIAPRWPRTWRTRRNGAPTSKSRNKLAGIRERNQAPEELITKARRYLNMVGWIAGPARSEL